MERWDGNAKAYSTCHRCRGEHAVLRRGHAGLGHAGTGAECAGAVVFASGDDIRAHASDERHTSGFHVSRMAVSVAGVGLGSGVVACRDGTPGTKTDATVSAVCGLPT
ncbi:hypothetical protein ACOJUR_08585 [Alicyclobacillus tolerans]|uniref:hypothetical protein n=1 Tax=Alicyclobacillus tolerans TaxID=90970 RepID=UPI003B795E70